MFLFSRPDRINEPLYVLTSVFNARRFRSRWKLYADFTRMVQASGAILYTVEVAFGARDFVLKDIAGPNYLPLRTNDELWLKENALNLLWQRLPCDWKYAGYLDADVGFARSDWANEILHQLQHYAVVQPFSAVTDLDPEHGVLDYAKKIQSYIFQHLHGKHSIKHGYKDNGYYYGPMGHPGFGMFFRREAFVGLGGLIDWAILGSGDRHMCDFLTGYPKWPHYLGKGGVLRSKKWYARAQEVIRRFGSVGYVDGLLLHYWHGSKANRGYQDRYKILQGAHFDPDHDLYRDDQGLWQLNRNNLQLREGLRAYFRQRNEDSIDV